MTNELSRRKFLERIGLGTAAGASFSLLKDVAAAAPAAPATLPSRTLGKTGAKVSILAFGCGSRFLMYEEEEKALAALNHAIDLGITYLDTAYAYGDGKSESRVGQVMADDLAKIEAPDGAMKGALEARDQKMARFIGMTSHTNGEVMARAIRNNDLDCVQIALNAARNGRFEELALPEANKKKLGIIAMKVTGQEFLLGNGAGKTDIKSLLRYSMSLPVTTAVVGMPHLEMLEQNIEIAKTFSPLHGDQMENLRKEIMPSRDGMEKRLSGHLDGPTMTPEIFNA
jgi:uncharacterized protein